LDTSLDFYCLTTKDINIFFIGEGYFLFVGFFSNQPLENLFSRRANWWCLLSWSQVEECPSIGSTVSLPPPFSDQTFSIPNGIFFLSIETKKNYNAN
jgi:hypothetical protein